jgi:hypothetical protein
MGVMKNVIKILVISAFPTMAWKRFLALPFLLNES